LPEFLFTIKGKTVRKMLENVVANKSKQAFMLLMNSDSFRTLAWAKTDLTQYPNMVVSAPGPKSKEQHDRCTKYFEELSDQVKLFPVTCVAVRDAYKESFEAISASSSYGGNPMACAAALESTKVIEEEKLNEWALFHLGEVALNRMIEMQQRNPIIGHVRANGYLMGIELVKDRSTKKPFDKAGAPVYQKAFAKGLAWNPAGHILRMSPPIVMDEKTLIKGIDIIEEAIGEVEKEQGYC